MKESRLGIPVRDSEEKLPGFASERLLQVVDAAITDGAHRKIPRGIKSATWAKNLQVLDSYLHTQDSLETIGGGNCTRQNVHSTMRRTVERLRENSSESTKQKYPLEELFPRQSMLQRRLERRRGVSYKVAQAIGRGQTIEEIQEELGLSREQIDSARRVLGRLGIEVPLTQRACFIQDRIAENRALAAELKKPHRDEEIRDLLGKVTGNFLKSDQQREEPSLTLVLHVARGTGFRFWSRHRHDFTESLERDGLPVGRLIQLVKLGPRKYERLRSFIAAQHEARAKRVFLKDPNLQRFRRTP